MSKHLGTFQIDGDVYVDGLFGFSYPQIDLLNRDDADLATGIDYYVKPRRIDYNNNLRFCRGNIVAISSSITLVIRDFYEYYMKSVGAYEPIIADYHTEDLIDELAHFLPSTSFYAMNSGLPTLINLTNFIYSPEQKYLRLYDANGRGITIDGEVVTIKKS